LPPTDHADADVDADGRRTPTTQLAGVEQVEAEPVEAEPLKAEPVEAEPLKAEPLKAEP